jgi:hypothetical protein
MEKFVIALIALAAIAVTFFAVCVVVSAIRYIYGEVIHTIKNFKRSTREFMWDVEWKFNHR